MSDYLLVDADIKRIMRDNALALLSPA